MEGSRDLEHSVAGNGGAGVVDDVDVFPQTSGAQEDTAAGSSGEQGSDVPEKEVSSGEEQAGDVDEGEVPSYDALLEMLREQLRASQGELANRLSDQQVLARSRSELASGELSQAQRDREKTLELLEASRLEGKVGEGRKRSRSALKRRAEKKLSREYISAEMKNAYNAVVNTNIRYYNSVAIRVARGEKSVDVKVIDAVAAHAQGGGPPAEVTKASKEQRVMNRRIA